MIQALSRLCHFANEILFLCRLGNRWKILDLNYTRITTKYIKANMHLDLQSIYIILNLKVIFNLISKYVSIYKSFVKLAYNKKCIV